MRWVVRRVVPRSARNWLRSPSRTARWILDEAAHRLGRDVEVALRPRWSPRCHPAAERVFRVLRDDPEQAAELDAFLDSCHPGMVLFDAGAHFGVFSLAALWRGGSGARAVAIEPSPAACRILSIHAALNGASDRIRILQAAVSDRPGTVRMLDAGVIAAGYFVSDGGDRGRAAGGRARNARAASVPAMSARARNASAPSDRPPGDFTEVRAVTLEGVARESGLAPTHLKIDVEGAEDAVLRGAGGILDGPAPPLVFLELHGGIQRRAGHDPAAALRLLRAKGYEILPADGLPGDDGALTGGEVRRVVARPRR